MLVLVTNSPRAWKMVPYETVQLVEDIEFYDKLIWFFGVCSCYKRKSSSFVRSDAHDSNCSASLAPAGKTER